MTNNSAYSPVEGLLDLACRNGVDVRPTLLRVLTDLYVQQRSHSAEEEAQYVELSRRLIEAADAHTRNAVAERLAGYAHAPAPILELLGKSAAEAPLVPAMTADAAAAPLDLIELFFSADRQERRLILVNLDAGLTRTRVEPVPGAAEMCRQLEAAVLSHNTGEFSRLLQNALSLPAAVAERVASDPSGEAVVVAAKALAMPPASLQRILLFINPAIGQSVEQVYELANLYDEMTFASAQMMIRLWRGETGKRRTAKYQSSLYDDEKRPARFVATTTRHRSERRSDALAARFKNSGR